MYKIFCEGMLAQCWLWKEPMWSWRFKQVYPARLQEKFIYIETFCFQMTDSKHILTKLKQAEIHAVAGLIKRYFRDLPEPIFTQNLYCKIKDGFGKPQFLLTFYLDLLTVP